MPHVASRTGRWIDSIKINAIAATTQEGRCFWAKRRLPASRVLIPCANAFFRATGNPVAVLARQAEWRQWEIDSFRLLHGAEGFRTFADPHGTVYAEQLPGISLETLADTGGLSPEVLDAAARELRRAHSLPCERFPGGWSHADPHIGNFLFEAASGRARLIDFEAVHLSRLSPVERHADDLLVVILCLMHYFPAQPWLAACTRFLAAYLEAPCPPQASALPVAELMAELHRRLVYPAGPGRLWWAIRTGYLTAAECRARIATLRQQPALAGFSKKVDA